MQEFYPVNFKPIDVSPGLNLLTTGLEKQFQQQEKNNKMKLDTMMHYSETLNQLNLNPTDAYEASLADKIHKFLDPSEALSKGMSPQELMEDLYKKKTSPELRGLVLDFHKNQQSKKAGLAMYSKQPDRWKEDPSAMFDSSYSEPFSMEALNAGKFTETEYAVDKIVREKQAVYDLIRDQYGLEGDANYKKGIELGYTPMNPYEKAELQRETSKANTDAQYDRQDKNAQLRHDLRLEQIEYEYNLKNEANGGTTSTVSELSSAEIVKYAKANKLIPSNIASNSIFVNKEKGTITYTTPSEYKFSGWKQWKDYIIESEQLSPSEIDNLYSGWENPASASSYDAIEEKGWQKAYEATFGKKHTASVTLKVDSKSVEVPYMSSGQSGQASAPTSTQNSLQDSATLDKRVSDVQNILDGKATGYTGSIVGGRLAIHDKNTDQVEYIDLHPEVLSKLK